MVDRIAALGPGGRRPSQEGAGRADRAARRRRVHPAPGRAPGAALARRDLASTGRPPVTLATAVAAMRRSFAEVTEVTSAVQSVWAAVGPPLDAATADLARSRPLAAGLGAETEAAFSDGRRRPRGAAGRLQRRSAGAHAGRPRRHRGRRPARGRRRRLAARIAELDRLRQQARAPHRLARRRGRRRRADRQDAVAAWQRAAARVARCRRLRPTSPSRRWPACRALAARRPVEPAGGGTRPVRGGPGRVGRPDRPSCARRRRPRSVSGTSCAGCCAPTRPRPPASARPRTRDLPPATTRRASCSGRHRATWRRPRRPWRTTSMRSWRQGRQ